MTWAKVGNLRGPKGDPGEASQEPGPKGDPGQDSIVPGPQGDPGPSAYEAAVAGGFSGSQAQWLASLKGDPGQDGADSTVPGPKGDKGDPGDPSSVAGPAGLDGRSAYEIARDHGYGGTETQWLTTLQGAPGTDGADSTVPGPKGDQGDKGDTGESAPFPQFPVNHVLLSVDNVNPATWLGYGTWSQVAQGLFLAGQTGAQAGASTIGSATHSHTFTQPSDHATQTHSGTGVADHTVTQPSAHSNHAFTQPGAHTFTQPSAHGAISSHSGTAVGTSGAGSAHTHTQGAVTQPTIAWPAGVPTAATEAAHTHTGASAGTTPKLVTSNTSTGVPLVTGGGTAHGHTLSWPVGVPTASAGAVANPASESAHTHAAGTVTQPSDHSALTNNHSGGAVDAHSGGAVDGHSAHAGTAVSAHSVTQPANHLGQGHVGGAVAVGDSTPPGFVVYVWQRTA